VRNPDRGVTSPNPAAVLASTRFLVGANAHNAHVQQIARAFYEAGALHAYATGGADVARSAPMRWARAALTAVSPALDRRLGRRAVTGVPASMVYPSWRWEAPRVLASRLAAAAPVEDWLWERSEKALDRRCAAWLARPEVGGFLGVEYGALESLHAARALGKAGVVAFLSPHHKTREKWVDRELDVHPGLLAAGRSRVERLAPVRDARRDEEAEVADWIETGSSFTTRSLVEAGFPAWKILTVPLGGPDPVDERGLPIRIPSGLRVAYVGPVSVRKGAHYLLRAWRRVHGRGARLDFYGKVLLSAGVGVEAQRGAGSDAITFHGPVPAADLADVYLQSSVLVLPTLCDGFGLVVSEALAHGLPVVTTSNAGAADLVVQGVNGFVIPPADEDALVSVLQWCADHPDELFAMRRPALARAGCSTWAHFRRRHVEAIGAALGGRR
jgi:glycosyltransferase involved in cell wall biosynthesis